MTAMVDGGGDDGDDLASHGPAVLHLESFWLPRSRCAVWCGQHNRSNRRVCLVAPLAEGGPAGRASAMLPGFEADQPRGARATPGRSLELAVLQRACSVHMGLRWPKTSQPGPTFLQLVSPMSIQIPQPHGISTQPRLFDSALSSSFGVISAYTLCCTPPTLPEVLRPVSSTPKSSQSDESHPAVSALQSHTNIWKHLSPRPSRAPPPPLSVHALVFPFLDHRTQPIEASPLIEGTQKSWRPSMNPTIPIDRGRTTWQTFQVPDGPGSCRPSSLAHGLES